MRGTYIGCINFWGLWIWNRIKGKFNKNMNGWENIFILPQWFNYYPVDGIFSISR